MRIIWRAINDTSPTVLVSDCLFPNLCLAHRINWTEPWVPSVHPQKSTPASTGGSGDGEGGEGTEGDNSAFYGGAQGSAGEEEGMGEGSDSDSDSDNEGAGTAAVGSKPQGQQLQQVMEETMAQQAQSMDDNRCDLLWQGSLPKRCFTGFKFQEAQTEVAARKLMKAKGVLHYWDMVENADSILASAAAPALF